jgi:MFS family permease
MLLLIATVPLQRRASGIPAPTAPTGGSSAGDTTSRAQAIALIPYIRAHRSTILPFVVGVAVAVFGFGASGAWVVVILMRIYGQTAAEVGAVITPMVLASTAAGFVVSVYGVRRFGERFGDRLPVRALWIAYVVTACANVTLAFTATAVQFYVVAFLGSILTSAANMLYPTAIQSMAPAHLRARMVSIQSIASLAMGALGPPTVGWISDRMQDVPNGLLLASIGVAVPTLLLSAVLLRLSERTFTQTAATVQHIDGVEARPEAAA